MSEMMLDWVAGPLARLSWQRTSWHLSWGTVESAERREARERGRRQEQLRFHLGRGRLARDAGNFERGASEARKAAAANPQSAWALALLGQCLTRQKMSDLSGARRVLERARVLEPTNGYFVRLLLDVLDAQGDVHGRADLLARAWWQGAPVERWLPDGPPVPSANRDAAAASASAANASARPDAASASDPGSSSRAAQLASRQPVGA